MFFASPNKKEDQKEFTVSGTYNNIYLLFWPGICYFFSLCHKIVQRDLASLSSHKTSHLSITLMTSLCWLSKVSKKWLLLHKPWYWYRHVLQIVGDKTCKDLMKFFFFLKWLGACRNIPAKVKDKLWHLVIPPTKKKNPVPGRTIWVLEWIIPYLGTLVQSYTWSQGSLPPLNKSWNRKGLFSTDPGGENSSVA